MNDRFNKDFDNIFGDFTKQATLDPLASTRNCISPRGAMFPNAQKAYPGSIGARQPVTSSGMRHKGQP